MSTLAVTGGLLSPDRALGLALIAAKTAAVYVFLVAGLRLLGKRELGQMNIYDLVLIIVLANAVQNAMVGDDTTLLGGLVAASTLLVLNRAFSWALERSEALETLMVGQPVVILTNGRLLRKAMKREGVTEDEVLAALREHGLESPEEAALCVLEVDGTLSIVPQQGGINRTRRHFRALRLP